MRQPSTSTGHVPSARTPPVGNVSAVLTYQDESKLPAYYNEDIIPDPETGLNLPVRILDYFYFCDAVQFVPVPLEHLGAATSTAIVFEVDEWSIEYGSPPLLWLKSKRACQPAACHITSSARYKLLQPKPSYKHYFSTIQRKFEVCTGIYNLMEADKKVSYADVVAHMHARYGITEDYVVKEAASVLKGLLEAYPEYRTTPFFLKLRDVLTAKSSSVTPKSPRKEKDVARARASDSPVLTFTFSSAA
ncbi:uncharacterized protein ACA1_055790 [Acanthamoeba castellanii str. Neff]|uniref:RFTS domain-containing protein n=1 Tax=Acanthamoeba castellanii (strain ATCC 30010 / Neff) TaxID=1257118 RepID=L8H7U3_ACACF|nr:uncharacterized protein ACA1_055790 [Acanthamoeba castellanii str. Neff]ELR20803.1 hypothetical protein ACA1_055790 [Acanthamoeba castellanii str. Neff]